jgi:DNA mismatch repair protein MutS2
MIYPSRFEEKIGFDKIRQLIANECISSMGKKFVEKIRFSSKREIIENMLEQIKEFKDILQFGKPFPSEDYIDMRDVLNELKIPGTYIEQESLFDLKTSLKTISAVYNYIKALDVEDFSSLHDLVKQLFFPEEIIFSAEKIIDE